MRIISDGSRGAQSGQSGVTDVYYRDAQAFLEKRGQNRHEGQGSTS
jgi:hypothetical protein